ncbi:MAG: hypothetical protein OEY57_04630, partial [Nitrospirota bacterium]|nr:hypothetical protein [Nitrospirota bacterium]
MALLGFPCWAGRNHIKLLKTTKNKKKLNLSDHIADKEKYGRILHEYLVFRLARHDHCVSFPKNLASALPPSLYSYEVAIRSFWKAKAILIFFQSQPTCIEEYGDSSEQGLGKRIG